MAARLKVIVTDEKGTVMNNFTVVEEDDDSLVKLEQRLFGVVSDNFFVEEEK